MPNILPIAITGASLKLLNSVVAGNDTYRNASYWHHELNILEIDGNEYSYNTVDRDSRGLYFQSRSPLIINVQNRFVNTNAYEYIK